MACSGERARKRLCEDILGGEDLQDVHFQGGRHVCDKLHEDVYVSSSPPASPHSPHLIALRIQAMPFAPWTLDTGHLKPSRPKVKFESYGQSSPNVPSLPCLGRAKEHGLEKFQRFSPLRSAHIRNVSRHDPVAPVSTRTGQISVGTFRFSAVANARTCLANCATTCTTVVPHRFPAMGQRTCRQTSYPPRPSCN